MLIWKELRAEPRTDANGEFLSRTCPLYYPAWYERLKQRPWDVIVIAPGRRSLGNIWPRPAGRAHDLPSTAGSESHRPIRCEEGRPFEGVEASVALIAAGQRTVRFRAVPEFLDFTTAASRRTRGPCRRPIYARRSSSRAAAGVHLNYPGRHAGWLAATTMWPAAEFASHSRDARWRCGTPLRRSCRFVCRHAEGRQVDHGNRHCRCRHGQPGGGIQVLAWGQP